MADALRGSSKEVDLGIEAFVVAARISLAKVMLVLLDSKSRVVALTDLGDVSGEIDSVGIQDH